MNRTELVEKIKTGRHQLDDLLGRIPADEKVKPALAGGWSVKDLLAHVGWWEQRAVDLYMESVAEGAPGFRIMADEVDKYNARTYETYRSESLDGVMLFESEAYRRLLWLSENAPESDLFDPQRFGWTEGSPFYLNIEWNSYGHYEEHLPALELLAISADQPTVVSAGLGFLVQNGRDIDQALAAHLFGEKPAEEVLDVLGRYQNPDGGFTRLEVDIGAVVSNPFATELALRVMTWLEPFPAGHPVAQKAVEYLENNQDEEGNWRFTEAVLADRLAPWFEHWQWPNLNPSGQIAGHLKRLGLGSERLHKRVQELFERLAKPEDLQGEYYDVLPYALYLQAEQGINNEGELLAGLREWLLEEEIEQKQDAAHFFELVLHPDSPVARSLPEEVVSRQFDRLLAEQKEDGGWPTPYNLEWRPWITGQNLAILRAYQRI